MAEMVHHQELIRSSHIQWGLKKIRLRVNNDDFLITYIVAFVVFIILDKNFLGNMNRTVIWCFICIQACAPVDMDFPGSIEEFF